MCPGSRISARGDASSLTRSTPAAHYRPDATHPRPQNGATMPDRPSRVYVVQGRGQRDYRDCQAALDRVPAKLTSLPFTDSETELIDFARDADGLIVAGTP